MKDTGIYRPIKRRLGSREEIWEEVDRVLRLRMAEMGALDIKLPLPTRVKIPDSDGSNWFMKWDEHARGHKALVQEVVECARIKWNLK